MGNYTGLRCDIVLLDESFPAIQKLYELWMLPASSPFSSEEPWLVVAQAFPQFPTLANWAEVGRANFIPFGGIEISQWNENDPEWPMGFRAAPSSDTKRWRFQCSLKNYKQEISSFMNWVIEPMAYQVHHLETLYCEDDESTTYQERLTVTMRRQDIQRALAEREMQIMAAIEQDPEMRTHRGLIVDG